MKFKNIKLGQEFMYNDLHYTKTEYNKAFNDRHGYFIIYPNEKVQSLENFYFKEMFLDFLKSLGIPLFAFAIVWLICVIIILNIVEII